MDISFFLEGVGTGHGRISTLDGEVSFVPVPFRVLDRGRAIPRPILSVVSIEFLPYPHGTMLRSWDSHPMMP
jgi:hypothetical protein